MPPAKGGIFVCYNTFMSWASRRKFLYLAILFLALAVVAVALGVYLFTNAPTCFDGTQNGNESGIDCGGPCQKVCALETSPLVVRWVRAFEVIPGFWTFTSYVVNPNQRASVEKISYTFRGFDARGILVAERMGSTYLSPGLTPIIETNVSTGERSITRSFIEFTPEDPEFRLTAGHAPSLVVENQELTDEATRPRLTATLRNTGLDPVTNIEVAAVVFDAGGNAIAASRTVVARLEKGAREELVFTWPKAFSAPVVTVEITPRAKY